MRTILMTALFAAGIGLVGTVGVSGSTSDSSITQPASIDLMPMGYALTKLDENKAQDEIAWSVNRGELRVRENKVAISEQSAGGKGENARRFSTRKKKRGV